MKRTFLPLSVAALLPSATPEAPATANPFKAAGLRRLLLLAGLLFTFAFSAQAQYDPIVSSGSGCSSNGTYTYTALQNGKPKYLNGSLSIEWSGTKWEVKIFSSVLYENTQDTPLPSCSGWTAPGTCSGTFMISGGCQPINGPACGTYYTVTTTSGLPSTNTLGVYAEGDNIYVASVNGLRMSTNGGVSFSTILALFTRDVYAVGNTIYAGMNVGGLNISTNGGLNFTAYTTANGLGGSRVYRVYPVGSTIYAATNGGLSISTNGGTNFTNYTTANGLGSNDVRGVYVIGNTVYAATAGGLSISTNGGASYTNYTTANGLGNNFIYWVHVVGNTVYAGTEGGVSISTNGGTSYTTSTTANGLGSNTVHKVYAIGNTVYAATQGGLSISTNGGTSYTNYTTVNGLGHNTVFAVYAEANRVYAGTSSASSSLSYCCVVTVTPAVAVAAVPSGSIAPGTSVTFTATPTNGGILPAYQWKVNGNNVGTNSNTYTDATLANGDVVTCVLTSSDLCAVPTMGTSGGITMEVSAPCPPAGETWTAQSAAEASGWFSVTYGNGLFVAVATNGTNRVMTSPDGITWTAHSAAEANQWNNVTYGNGLFVAVSNDGTNRVMTSPDGITWTARAASQANYWYSVTYGNGLFVAVATDGTNRVMTSPDGITWTARSAAQANLWRSVTYGNGLFVAVAASGTNRVMTSPDGITWTARSAAVANPWVSVTYGNGLFVAVSVLNTNQVMTSPDGITWTARTAAAANQWTCVTYGNGLFVATATTGTNRVMTSPDGITWTGRTAAAANQWNSVTYGNGLFLAVANNGTNRVMTSIGGVTPSLSITADPGNSITEGTSVTFTATPTNGGTTPAYQWKKNSNNVGTNSATYTDAALLNGDVVTCMMTSNDPCAVPTMATSNSVTMTVTIPCPPVFIEATNNPFEQVRESSIAFADVNGDTYPDVLITGNNTAGEGKPGQAKSASIPGPVAILYTNNGSGVFAEVIGTPFEGIDRGDVAFADVNGDTYQDVLVTGVNATFAKIAKLYTNNSSGVFTEVMGTPFTGVEGGSVAFADVDGDTDKDVLVTGYAAGNTPIAKLYTNNGSGVFTEVMGTPFDGVWVSSIAFADVDGDTDQDVLITGSTASIGRIAKLYTNNGSGVFTEVSGTPFVGVGNSSIAFADVDGDTDQDVLITGRTDGNVRHAILYTNNGSGVFTEVMGTPFIGVSNNSIAFADVDGDTDKDVLISGINASNVQTSKLYTNNGSGVFTEVTGTPFEGVGRGSVAFADVDGDSDQDVMITGENTSFLPFSQLYLNGNEASVVIAADPGNSIIAGTSVTFTATPTNGGTMPVYQWKVNGINVGTDSDTYTDATLVNDDVVTCMMTSNDPCADPAMATSNGITMEVSAPCPPAGETWTAQTAAETNQWRSVTYGNGLFVAVAIDGTNRVMTSPDGITWTAHTAAEANAWQSVTFANGLFVAVASNGTNRVMTSPDGITWTARTAAEQNGWASVTYGNGLFVAVAYSGTNRVMTSPDGITWTAQTPAATNQWLSVNFGNGLFVAVAQDGANRVMTSPDGITWTVQTAAQANNWRWVTYGNGLFVAVAENGTNRVMTSPDGITWTARTAAEQNAWAAVTYGNDLFVAVAYSGANRVMTSLDGITWTAQTAAQANIWQSVTYGNGLFMAVALTGSNRVMTSPGGVVTTVSILSDDADNSIAPGTSVTFTATPTNGGTMPAYQWKVNGGNVGTNSNTYTDAALVNDDVVTCMMTSNDPCADPATAVSNEITMEVAPSCAGITTRIYVTTTGTGNGSSWANATNNLQAAIDNTCGATEIWMAEGTYKPAAYPTGCTDCTSPRQYAFMLKDGIKIYGGFDGTESLLTDRVPGNETILSGDIDNNNISDDGNAYHIIVSINDSGVVLDGLTIKHGNSTGAGGSATYFIEGEYVFDEDAVVYFKIVNAFTINKVKFVENYGVRYGGALYIEETGGHCAITNCEFTDNNSGSYAGGIYLEDSGENGGYTTIDNCLFTNNHCDDYGGAIYAYSVSNDTISNCQFTGNSSSREAGAIYMNYQAIGTSTTIMGCTFTVNTATDYGGAIFTYEPEGNYIIADCQFNGNATEDSGGAIYMIYSGYNGDNYNLITGCGFTENASVNGGAIYSEENYTLDTISNCQFTGNVAEYGGAVYIGSEASMFIADCVFSENYAMSNGGAIYNDSEAEEANSTIEGCQFTDNTAVGAGGAILLDDSSPMNMKDCIFTGNSAELGGAVYDLSYYAYTMDSCQFTGNASTGDGGAIYFDYPAYYSSPMIVTNCQFEDNTSDEDGGAVHLYAPSYDGVMGFTDCHFESNVAAGDGGAIAYESIYDEGVEIDRCTFLENAAQYGGAIAGTVDDESVLMTISNSLFAKNSAQGDEDFPGGGAIYNYYLTEVTVTNCTFADNTSVTSAGGAIVNDNSALTMVNCILWGNIGGEGEINEQQLYNFAGATANIANSDMEGGLPAGATNGGSNIYTDPLFTDAANNDYTLDGCSPAINAGDNTGVAATDLTGAARIQDGTVDMGAYENTPTEGIITSVSVANISAANCNNTTCTTDDTYTANVTVTYSSKPASGTLSLTGPNITVPVMVVDITSIGATSHTFTGVTMLADGGDIDLTATFSEGCSFNDGEAGTAPACGAFVPGNVEVTGFTDPNDNGTYTPDGTENNAPRWSNTVCKIFWDAGNGAWFIQRLGSSPFTIGTNYSGNIELLPCSNWFAFGFGTAMLNAGCGSLAGTVCAVSNITLANTSGCNNPGNTTTPLDDYFTADVTVTFAFAPAGGTLTLKRGTTVVATTSADLTCTTTHTFTGVQMSANGSSIVLTAEFTSGCTFTSGSLGTAPAACSCVPATFTACPTAQTVSTTPTTCNTAVNFTATADGSPAPVMTYAFSGVTMGSGSGTGSGATFNLGVTNVVVTATNDCGNPTCSFTVTVSDNTQPSVACQNHTVALNTNGMASIVTANVFESGADNCGTVNQVSVSPNSFNCSNLGANTVTLVVNDGNGNVAQCTTSVTVQDVIAPSVTCKPYTAQLNASGTASITPANVYLSGTDNCGTVNFTGVTPNSFTCANVGANTVTLTVNDGHGNVASCTSSVIVQDLVLPTALCKNATVQLNAAGTGSTTAAAVNNGSSDACGIASMSLSQAAFTCANYGANTVTLTVTDVNNNVKTCTATVTVQDLIAPTVNCVASLSPSLDAQGEVFITPAQVFLNGADNCGTVNLASVSPSYFSCNDEEPNTATLTVNDGHGNTATCTTTVHIQDDFIVITSVSTVNASCGQINGGITITATSLGGQLGYSINGGQSYNLTGIFPGLSAGTYEVVVLAFGTAGCSEYYGMVTVGSIGSVQAWYKDFDNDGYSDGQSQQACTQPPGYKLAANLTATSGDCNDNDPLQKPGQVWFKDSDNDGYSNGVVLIQCARPNGFKAAGELLGASIDCNDANAAIHPGAAEICNSLDDDCDGLIDEGTTGGLTFVGNVSLTNQAAVNAFSSCYSVIQGNLLVQNSGVLNLTNLANLVKVTGNVTIKNTSIVNMNGLHSLDTIGGNLTINGNNFGVSLHSLDGLEDLDWVGGTLKVYQNSLLTDCCAIHHLIGAEPNGVGGIISIYSNLTTCDNMAAINADCGGSNIILPPGSEGSEIGNWELGIGKVRLEIFPNPVSSSAGRELTVRIEGEFKEGSLRVFDSMGRMVVFQKLSSGTTELQLETKDWRTGIYLVQTLLDGVALTKKLVVE